MPDFGVTQKGFVIKPLAAILQDKFDRAQAMFGGDVDLRSTSSLRKILDISSAEDLNLWKGMEQFYYSNFISTASGDGLDLLGEDMGVTRRFLNSRGTAKLKLSGGAPNQTYHLPVGTLLETVAPVRNFRTLESVALSEQTKEATIEVEALERGPAGNVPVNAINKINAEYAARHLSLGDAAIAVSNEAVTNG